MNTQNIIEKIDGVIEILSTTLKEAEAEDGWTLESKNAARKFFEGIKNQLKSGEEPEINVSRNIVRALDHWGVIKGELLEKIAQISGELISRQNFK